MNEVALSNDLTQLTTEIKTYQRIGGHAIVEIGRRLKLVKEHDLTHGEYLNWLKSIKIDETFARRAITISDEFSNQATLPDLGATALYLIATMPPDEREKPQQLSSGEVKKPDEMTVRELREVKRKLKEKEQALQDKDNQINQQAEMIDRLNEREPKVIEKEVEVEKVPKDYYLVKGKAENLQDVTNQLDADNQQLRSELREMEKKLKASDNSKTNDYQKQIDDLKHEISSLNHIKDVNSALNVFLEKTAPISLTDELKSVSRQPDIAQTLTSDIKAVKKWCDLALNDLSKNTFIEGDFSNE
jgi:hypothetical protein